MDRSMLSPGTAGLLTRGLEASPGIPRPRRPLWIVVFPYAIAAAVAGLILAAAGRTVVAAPHVDVLQAVFDPAETGAGAAAPPVAGAARASASVQAAGWLEADPFVVACAGLADGVVAEVLVLEGDAVEEGQPVARLVAADAELGLRAAEAELASAVAALESERAELSAAEMVWSEPVDRDRELAVASAALARAEAELAQLPSLIAAERALREQLEEQLERSVAAMSGGGANELETIVLQKRVAAQTASFDAMVLREGMLRAAVARAEGELRAAERGSRLRIDETRALGAARARVAEREAMVRVAEVRRDESRLRLERMEIRAPIAGVVQRRLMTPGRRIMPASDDPEGAIVAMIYDPAKLQVRVDVPLADAGSIEVGQECEVVVEIMPGATVRGVVTRIGHEANLQKNTLEVKVRVIDPPPMLRPEMLTRVRFLANGGGARGIPSASGSASEAGFASRVLVPIDAIDQAAGGDRVWIVRERRGDGGVVDPVAVEVLGSVSGQWRRVEGGVRPGDVLVARPSGLRAGMAVRVRGLAAPEREGGGA